MTDAFNTIREYPKKILLIGNVIFLLLSFILLFSWLTLFFITATSRTGSICWGTGCNEAVWQTDLSRELGQYFSISNASIKPILLVFHLSLFIFIFRFAKNRNRSLLLLDFGILNLFWMLISTMVFTGMYFGLKAATPKPQYPIITNLTTGETQTGNLPKQDATTNDVYMVITGPAEPPASSCVIADETGWSVYDPQDRRCIIASKIPGWMYGKQLAWSGLVTFAFLVLGLSISQATGWLYRILQRCTARQQAVISLASILLIMAVLLLEIRVFGYLLLLSQASLGEPVSSG